MDIKLDLRCRSTARFLLFLALFLCAGFMSQAQVGGTATANGISGSYNATAGSTVGFEAQGGSGPGAGVSFSWEYSATGAVNTYAAISGQTSATYTINSFTKFNIGYYRRRTTIGGLFATSTAVSVTASYCTAGSIKGNFTDPQAVYPWNVLAAIAKVKINTLDNSSLGAPLPAPYYTSFVPMGTTLNKGVSYALSVWIAGDTEAEVWIDWNHDGVFENNAAEHTYIGSFDAQVADATTGIYHDTLTTAILVPANAVSGTTIMRVRATSLVVETGKPCGNVADGEVEDYQITVADPPACAGLPPIVLTTASATSVCPGRKVTFGLSTINNSSGISYQWYNNAGAIPGATNCVYTTVITAADNYHCDITCSASGQTRSSTNVAVSITNWMECYCAPSADLYPLYVGEISNATFSAPINPINNNSSNYNVQSGYSDFTSILPPATVYIDSTVALTVTTSAEQQGWAWIDYNHNAAFEQNEAILLQDDIDDDWPFIQDGTVKIPSTALLGPTVLRFRHGLNIGTAATWVPIEPWHACGYSVTGEAEDYAINIIAPCAGTPAPGNTIASANPVCVNTNVTLSLQNAMPYNTGVTYQWYNLSGVIPGATNSTYTIVNFNTPNTYHCKVTCTKSGITTASSLLTLTANSSGNCFCAAASTNAPATNGYGAITNVSFKTLNNTSTVPASAPFYTNYAPMGTSVNIGSLYPSSLLSVTIAQFGKAGAWFDWNKNGIFENNLHEFVYLGNNATGAPVTFIQTVNVPANAVLGTTIMRVRSEWAFGTLDGNSACATTFIGETEDYAITVVDPNAKVYTFTGNGNWNVASNWANNAMPPAVLSGNDRIVIDPLPAGECVLNVEMRISNSAQLMVMPGKKFKVLGKLNVAN